MPKPLIDHSLSVNPSKRQLLLTLMGALGHQAVFAQANPLNQVGHQAIKKTILFEVDLLPGSLANDLWAILNQSSSSGSGVHINWLLLDHQGNPERALQLFNRLHQTHQPWAMVGGLDPNISKVLYKQAERHQLPYCVLWTTKPPPSHGARTPIIHWGINYRDWLEQALSVMQTHHFSKLGLLLTHSEDGRSLQDQMITKLNDVQVKEKSLNLYAIDWRYSNLQKQLPLQFFNQWQRGVQGFFVAGSAEDQWQLIRYIWQMRERIKQPIDLFCNHHLLEIKHLDTQMKKLAWEQTNVRIHCPVWSQGDIHLLNHLHRLKNDLLELFQAPNIQYSPDLASWPAYKKLELKYWGIL